MCDSVLKRKYTPTITDILRATDRQRSNRKFNFSLLQRSDPECNKQSYANTRILFTKDNIRGTTVRNHRRNRDERSSNHPYPPSSAFGHIFSLRGTLFVAASKGKGSGQPLDCLFIPTAFSSFGIYDTVIVISVTERMTIVLKFKHSCYLTLRKVYVPKTCQDGVAFNSSGQRRLKKEKKHILISARRILNKTEQNEKIKGIKIFDCYCAAAGGSYMVPIVIFSKIEGVGMEEILFEMFIFLFQRQMIKKQQQSNCFKADAFIFAQKRYCGKYSFGVAGISGVRVTFARKWFHVHLLVSGVRLDLPQVMFSLGFLDLS
ncbi:hypothetical protein WN51_03311 [Melipona quadrifasciata]|uniref:Uncharacterized protein n=1 Tax=Melipona quadrifasciata TaxID=166423 RepID=A0A0M8ZW87_9HYME|nr:hypothetical protein WN51_03311 [Melipona quadrifasciata]